MKPKAIEAALAKATGHANAWWRDERHEAEFGRSPENRRLAYGRAQGAATAVKIICEALKLPLPDGWTDMPPPGPPPVQT